MMHDGNNKLVTMFAVANIRLLFPDVPVRTLGRAMYLASISWSIAGARAKAQRIRRTETRVTVDRLVSHPLLEPLVEMLPYGTAEQYARRIRSYDDSQKGTVNARTNQTTANAQTPTP